MPKKKPMEGNPEVHQELEGFQLQINEFGEILSNTSVDKLNRFLNKHVEDKKFKDLDSIPYAQRGEDDMEDDFDDDDDDDFEDDDLEFDSEEDNEIADLVKNMEKDFGKKGKKDSEFEELGDDGLIDEYGEEYGEEDDYDFDDD